MDGGGKRVLEGFTGVRMGQTHIKKVESEKTVEMGERRSKAVKKGKKQFLKSRTRLVGAGLFFSTT